MAHIKQSNSTQQCYTIVVTDDWYGELSEHPSIINHPELFEIVNGEVPENATIQFLKYDELED